MAATGVLVVSIVAVTGYPSRNAPPKPAVSQPGAMAAPVHATSVQTQVPSPQAAEPAPIPSTIVTRPAPIVPEPPKQARLVTTHAGEPSDAAPRSSALTSVAASARTEPIEPASKTVVPEPATSAPAAQAHNAVDAAQAPVTITGCLETAVDEDRFRLTDTEGAGAPKARGWRSGFLKKHSADVDLVHLSDVAALKKLVGRRVVATGQLTNRELSLSSVESSGRRCD